MPVITISGYLASGAREIALAVAEKLELEFVDQAILVEAARELGVSVAAWRAATTVASTISERVAAALNSLMERSAAVGTFDPVSGGGMGLETVLTRTYGEAADLPSGEVRGQLDDDRYIRTLRSVITGVAARGQRRAAGAWIAGDPAGSAGHAARLRRSIEGVAEGQSRRTRGHERARR